MRVNRNFDGWGSSKWPYKPVWPRYGVWKGECDGRCSRAMLGCCTKREENLTSPLGVLHQGGERPWKGSRQRRRRCAHLALSVLCCGCCLFCFRYRLCARTVFIVLSVRCAFFLLFCIVRNVTKPSSTSFRRSHAQQACICSGRRLYNVFSHRKNLMRSAWMILSLL